MAVIWSRDTVKKTEPKKNKGCMHTCCSDKGIHARVTAHPIKVRLVTSITLCRLGVMGQGMICRAMASITAPILAFITVRPIVSLVAALVGMAVTSQPAYTVPTTVRRCGR